MAVGGIGGAILLMAVGAILAFAVTASVPHVDLVTVGVILLAAGAVWLIATLVLVAPRRTRAAGHGTVVTDEPVLPPGERRLDGPRGWPTGAPGEQTYRDDGPLY